MLLLVPHMGAGARELGASSAALPGSLAGRDQNGGQHCGMVGEATPATLVSCMGAGSHSLPMGWEQQEAGLATEQLGRDPVVVWAPASQVAALPTVPQHQPLACHFKYQKV